MPTDIGKIGKADAPSQEELNRAANALANALDAAEAGAVLTKYGATAIDLTLSTITVTPTNAAHSLSFDYSRFGNVTRKVVPSAASGAVVAFSGISGSCDATDQLYALDVYLPFHPDEFAGTGLTGIIFIRLSNGADATNRSTWAWNVEFLRQGWNTLKMWSGDTISSVGNSDQGNMGHGVSRGTGGTGFNFLSPLTYMNIEFTNLNGQSIYIDQLRKGAKAKPVLVVGFDSNGIDNSDNVFTEEVAPLLQGYGVKSYITCTNVYEMATAGSPSWARLIRLRNEFGWDVLNHTWNHGATSPGARRSCTVSRTSNVATVTVSGGHGIPVGQTIMASIRGASPSDLNGVFTMIAASSTTLTYAASGVDGAATGTIFLCTLLSEVINADTTALRAVCRHEIADVSRAMRALGLGSAAHILAYPNNSVPYLPVLQAICDEAGVAFGRAVRGGFCQINEFGVDNPLNFGSFELGSGTGATTLAYIQAKIAGAIGRGDHIWLYGHYILDEATVGQAVDTAYPPGSNGNPSVGNGYWYLGQLERLFTETILPAVTAGDLLVQSPTEWARALGRLKAA